MTDTTGHPVSAGRPDQEPLFGRAMAWVRANVHFVVAAGILTLTAVGWHTVIVVGGWFPMKVPVPWAAFEISQPDGTKVPWKAEISEDSRWINLAAEFPPYYRMAKKGELSEKADEATSGEVVHNSSILSSLNIPSSLTESQRKARVSNWYVSRFYVDNRTFEPGKRHTPYDVWHLDVTYYTGGVDLVPHTPESCLNAGGRQVVGSSEVRFTVHVPDRWKKWWDGKIVFRRVLSEDPATAEKSVDYYIFSLNGRPSTSWEAVRLKLSLPWVRHCYFAKIQFALRSSVEDIPEADKAAEHFAQHFLPEVLKGLPTPDDVQRPASGR
jgi:hypothetical protein